MVTATPSALSPFGMVNNSVCTGFSSSPCVAPVSKSKDGELQVGVLRSFGIAAVRGSSSSGSLGY